jgi:hypothetical protein
MAMETMMLFAGELSTNHGLQEMMVEGENYHVT